MATALAKNIVMWVNKIQLRKQYCGLNGAEGDYVEKPYTSLYVRLTNNCNAHCKFCIYRSKDTNRFNVSKFKYILTELTKTIELRKVSFTGGEPSTQINLLRDCLRIVKGIVPHTFTVMNSNGFKLSECVDIKELDNISLSRHHYVDSQHIKIMGTTDVALNAKLKSLKVGKIHLTCNLIRGYIDCGTEIQRYLEHASNLGIYDVGFVGLMPVNAFCKNHFVNFEKINLMYERIINNKIWRAQHKCKCANYLYLPEKDTKVVKFYCRFCNPFKEKQMQLVYDGQSLLDSFGGNIIV